MIRDKGVDVSTLPGLLDMADQVRYIMYKVIIEDCSRPERGFTGRETYRLQIKKKKNHRRRPSNKIIWADPEIF